MKCEKCNKNHDGLYGSGRFCSENCARSISTVEDNKKETKKSICIKCGNEIDINKRASHSVAKCDDCSGKYSIKRVYRRNMEECFIENSKTTRQRIKELIRKHNLLPLKCSKCGCGEVWYGKSLSLQLEHVNGKSDDNRIENLELLCPNCHSQTLTYAGKGKNKKINRVSDDSLIKALKTTPNIRQALLLVGLDSNGSTNYKRCELLLGR